tara:strand:+ start:91 stop:225 length:135 start_codon:yes stop_codon:yes gene_type:complete
MELHIKQNEPVRLDVFGKSVGVVVYAADLYHEWATSAHPVNVIN